jgi:N-acetylglucosaminyldiphosphoundecaprenol N-acetyl-beta-D-mannosaminyltransferase
MDGQHPESSQAYWVTGIPVSETPLGAVDAVFGRHSAAAAFLVTFVNPWACALSRKYPDFTDKLREFDQVCCDGSGMVKAAHVAGLAQVRRESFDFTSVAAPVFQAAQDQGLTTGLVGGAPGVSAQASEWLAEQNPTLNLVKSFSGFGEDVASALDFHVDNRTGLVVCGMGAPRQEQFLLDLRARGWTGIGFTCGGFMDQLVTGAQYYPPWIDRMNLRFLYRLYREPGRLWKRYLIDYQVFTGRFLGLCARRLVGAGRAVVVQSGQR